MCCWKNSLHTPPQLLPSSQPSLPRRGHYSHPRGCEVAHRGPSWKLLLDALLSTHIGRQMATQAAQVTSKRSLASAVDRVLALVLAVAGGHGTFDARLLVNEGLATGSLKVRGGGTCRGRREMVDHILLGFFSYGSS